MKYTVRFAHLSYINNLIEGDIIRRGHIIGRMGNTGSSDGAHLHLDVVEGEQDDRYTLADISTGKKTSDAKQATLFIDRELFGVEPEITTFYSDPRYLVKYGKYHFGYDVVPTNRKFTEDNYRIAWNRSPNGRVTKILTNDPGYGNCVMITFEA